MFKRNLLKKSIFKKDTNKRGLLNLSKRKALMAFLMALIIASSNISLFPPLSVYADDNNEEASTEEEEESIGGTILERTKGAVTCWEWERINGDNIREIMSDNRYHPVLFAGYRTNRFGKHSFFSSYSNRDCCFLPTNTTKWNNFVDDFNSVPNNPERDTSWEGHYYKYTGEEHSTSYYFNATSSIFYVNQEKGNRGITTKQFNSKKFFTQGDSMGVPWMRVYRWGPDYGRTMINLTFPKKQITNPEAMLYQPDDSDYYLYVAADDTGESRDEPLLYVLKSQVPGKNSVGRDEIHLVFSGEETYLLTYNNTYDDDVAGGGFGQNIVNGEENNSCLCLLSDQDCKYNIIPQGSKSSPLWKRKDGYYAANYMFHAFVGTPHTFTSLESQTISEGSFLPINSDAYLDADGLASQSEGILIPKGNTLTIDGGIMSVECAMINNGKIEVKNGGTLIIKEGGFIFPYTEECNGQGTITCNGGNIIVMEGGNIYGFCNGDTLTSNPYNTYDNAPLLLTGGASLVNYGQVVLTYCVLDNSSKLENRGKASLSVGYNRQDPLDMLYTSPSRIGKSDPANYNVNACTIGVFPLGYNLVVKSETKEDTSKDKVADITKAVVTYKSSDLGTIVVEKTAKFEHTGINGEDLAPSDKVNIVVPEY